MDAMPAETLSALKASIEKWERNAVAETPKEYLINADDCPLCDLFYDAACDGCPVSERAGDKRCRGTPYIAAGYARMDWFGEGERPDLQERARECARAEVAFLKSLLPTDAALSRAQAEGR